MSDSKLITQKGICYRCGRYGSTEKHHIFGGANRRLSEEDGLYVFLCHECHNEPPYGIHYYKIAMDWMHRTGQRAFEDELIENGASPDEARQRFMERYGKNYL